MQRKLLLLFFLAALAPFAFAQQAEASDLANYSAALDAKVEILNSNLTESPQTMLVRIVAHNPQDSDMPVYVLRKGEGGWEVVKLLGALAPKSDTRLELQVEATYGRNTRTRTWYAIVGRGDDGQLYGSAFELVEDWTDYEREIEASLTKAVVVAVPIIGSVLALLVVLVAFWVYGSRARRNPEYTLRTLVVPKIEGRPQEEWLADAMMHPATMVLELVCVALFVALMLDAASQAAGTGNGFNIMLLSGLGSFTIPFAYFLAAWRFERREEGKPLRFFAAMFVWGMFVAFLSFVVSSSLVLELRQYALVSSVIIATMFISPAVEETLKGLGVLLLSGHHDYNDSLTGMMLGFAKAIGEFGATITFVSNIPGETQTISSAIYSLIQTPDGDAAALRLVVVSIAIALAALVGSEWFARRAGKRLHGN